MALPFGYNDNATLHNGATPFADVRRLGLDGSQLVSTPGASGWIVPPETL